MTLVLKTDGGSTRPNPSWMCYLVSHVVAPGNLWSCVSSSHTILFLSLTSPPYQPCMVLRMEILSALQCFQIVDEGIEFIPESFSARTALPFVQNRLTGASVRESAQTNWKTLSPLPLKLTAPSFPLVVLLHQAPATAISNIRT
jgi:hypothetical protein